MRFLLAGVVSLGLLGCPEEKKVEPALAAPPPPVKVEKPVVPPTPVEPPVVVDAGAPPAAKLNGCGTCAPGEVCGRVVSPCKKAPCPESFECVLEAPRDVCGGCPPGQVCGSRVHPCLVPPCPSSPACEPAPPRE